MLKKYLFLLLLFTCMLHPVAAQPPAPTVSVANPLEREVVEWDEYTGRLEAVDFVEVRARVSGYLQSVEFDEGELVEKGQLLFVIDPRPFTAVLEQSQAELQQARASLNLAQKRLQRGEELRRQRAISTEDYDIRANEQRAAAAAVAAARARVSAAELDMSFTKVTAPIDGRISRYNVSVGNLISGGSDQSTLLTTIVSLNPIYCTFEASERDFLKYARLARSGQRASSREVRNPVYLQLADEEGFPHLGYMDFVDNRIDPNTATIQGRAVFENTEDRLLTPGLFARLRLLGSSRYTALQIPDEAVGSQQAQKFVMVVNAENQVQVRPIQTGPIVDGLRVIRSGLSKDDQVIVKGLMRARPGTQVTPQLVTIEAEPESVQLKVPEGLEAQPE